MPPIWMQEKMHSSAIAHIGFCRHGAAWAQQLSAMQSPQVVPSGVQVGGAVAQTPLAQVSEQQSENATQGPPVGVHAGAPQVPTLRPPSSANEHTISQHCAASVQTAPFG
jgi:hypothetical protein